MEKELYEQELHAKLLTRWQRIP